MATTSQDTGGLGLLQMLQQLGMPAPVAALLLQTLGPPPQRTENDGESGEAPPGAISYVDEGVPGNAPGTLGAAIAGGRQGLASQAAQAMGLPGQVGNLTGKAVGVGANILGVPSGVVGLLNTLFGAATKAATHNLNMSGRRVAPLTMGGPRTVIDNPPPNATFNDPANLSDVGGAPTGVPGATLGLGENAPANNTNLSMDVSMGPGNLGNNPAGLGPPGPAPAFGWPDMPSYVDIAANPTGVPAGPTSEANAVVAAISDAIAAALGQGEPSGGPGAPTGDSGPSSGEGGSTGTGGAPGDGGSGVGSF